ncbi:MAG: uroporphyrinogen decarboxylase family protein [Phycisphaeraceae bacterium]
MSKMTRRQRMQAIYAGQIPDRSAIKVWGAEPGQRCAHPAFEPVRDLAVARSDLLITLGFDLHHVYCGQHGKTLYEVRQQKTASPDWVEEILIYHTPRGDLREVNYIGTHGQPGYEVEFPLKEPDDIGKLLSMPYEPCPIDVQRFRAADVAVGDAGIAQYHLDNPLCALQRIIGPENFALWSFEAQDLMLEAVRVFAGRLQDQVKRALAAGVTGPFGWVGPELCIPPLMPMSAFEKFVFAIDKPTIDLIHEGGARVWVHCHGKMGPVLERFVAMGVDVLNPLEPPPMGDLTLAEAFGRVGNRVALEGNLETHDIMTVAPDVLRDKIHEALDAGRGRRHIFCPSAGYYENPQPTQREIENWILFIEEGVRYAEEISQ